MPKGEEHWVCGSCRSFNEGRAQRCYKCRTPRDLVEADPSQLIVAGVGTTESSQAVAAAAQASVAGDYRSSSMRAALVQWLIVATIAGTVIASVTGADAIALILAGRTAEATASTPILLLLGVLNLGLAVSALVAWAAWLSRVVDNVPAVGLGWPRVTRRAAFFENFLPGVNLFRIPSILRDVIGRLEPDGGRGNGLIVAAWLGLFGGLITPRVGGFVVGLFFVETLDDSLRASVILGQVGLGLTVVGAVFLIALVHRIESGMRAHAGEMAAASAAAAPVAAAEASV